MPTIQLSDRAQFSFPDTHVRKPLPFYHEWLAALRYGGHRQAIGQLSDDTGFCCLGVLSKVQGRLRSGNDGNGIGNTAVLAPSNPCAQALSRSGILPSESILTVDGALLDIVELSAMNDSGLSFIEIANVIEAVWCPVCEPTQSTEEAA